MDILSSIAQAAQAVRDKVPLVHHITNYVTVNDCANAVLAIGASPIMSDDIGECADITAISQALVVNMGTLNQRTIQSMIASGKRANELGVPVVFDPVGAGASQLRNDTAKAFLEQVTPAVIRGNLSEVSFLAGLEVATKGVDTAEADASNDPVAVAKTVAQKYGCVAAITGAVDVITDGTRLVKLANGHPMLSKVTGTGCMTSGLTGAFCGANSDYLVAAAGAILSMSLAGELSFAQYGEVGTGHFHMGIIDALSKLTEKDYLERGNADET